MLSPFSSFSSLSSAVPSNRPTIFLLLSHTEMSTFHIQRWAFPARRQLSCHTVHWSCTYWKPGKRRSRVIWTFTLAQMSEHAAILQRASLSESRSCFVKYGLNSFRISSVKKKNNIKIEQVALGICCTHCHWCQIMDFHFGSWPVLLIKMIFPSFSDQAHCLSPFSHWPFGTLLMLCRLSFCKAKNGGVSGVQNNCSWWFHCFASFKVLKSPH